MLTTDNVALITRKIFLLAVGINVNDESDKITN